MPDDAKTLVFSFIGMKAQEIIIGNSATINVTLAEEIVGIDDVVVVGYGTSERQKLTNSVSVARTDKIIEAPYSDIVSGLQGRVAGVIIQQNGGQPGSVPSISIRGAGEPLYVIDGVIADKTQFKNLAPIDIQSISFLKDVASATIYGFGASNGVVQVVTKVGDGKMKISYDYDMSFQRPVYIPNNTSAIEFYKYSRDAAFNSGVNPPSLPNDAQWAIIQKGGSPVDYPTVSRKNMYKDILNLSTPQNRHTLTLSGETSAGTKIYASLGAFSQDVNLKSSAYGLKRFTFQTRLLHEFGNSGIGMDVNISLQKQDNESSPSDYYTIFSNARYFLSRPFYLADGRYFGLGNPLAMADPAAGLFREETNLVNTQLALSWKVPGVNGLSFRAMGNYRYSSIFNKNWMANSYGAAQVYSYDGNPMINTTGNGGPSLSENYARSNTQNFQAQVNYNRSFKEHTIDFIGVYSFTKGVWDDLRAYRRDYVTPAIQQLDQGGLANQSNGGSGTHNSSEGYAATLKYDFASKYIVMVGARYDGFYGFASGKKYGFFPSASVAWNAGKENFLRPILEKAKIGNLKIHASWGESGSAPSAFGYLSRYSLSTSGFYNGSAQELTVSEGNLPPVRAAATWQSTKNTDIGADLTLFDGKLETGYSWFLYKTTGFLTAPSNRYSTTLGKSLPEENADSEFRRGGLEFYADYKGKIGKVNYHIGGNITRVNTFWVKKFDESAASYENPRTRTAQVLNAGNSAGIAYMNEGYYQSLSDIINNPRYNAAGQIYQGDIRYKDVNGDGQIDGNDQVRLKTPSTPLTTFGVNFGISYKAFSLEGLLQGTGTKSTFLGHIWQSQTEGAIYPIRLDYWTPNNTNAEFPRASDANVSNNTINSDFWLKDSKYLRLKSLSLSYNLLQGALNGSKVSKMFNSFSIVLSGTNLLTFSNVSKYFIDPEDANSSLYSYPISRTISIGIKVGF